MDIPEAKGFKVIFKYYEILDNDFTGVEIEVGDETYSNFDKSEYKDCFCDQDLFEDENFECDCDGEDKVYFNQSDTFVFPSKKIAIQIVKSAGYSLK